MMTGGEMGGSLGVIWTTAGLAFGLEHSHGALGYQACERLFTGLFDAP